MTTYYISPSGLDASNGLGPDASAATNKPWLTLGKAVNTGSSVVAGDTIYIAPGYYYSTLVTPIATISSAGSPTQIIGDPQNAQGFKDGSGVRLAPGQPYLTTRTAAEGTDAPIATNANGNLVSLNINKPSGLQFRKLFCETGNLSGGTGSCFIIDPSGGTDILIEDCVLWGTYGLRYVTGAPTAARNHTVRRCILNNLQGWLSFNIAVNSSPDDADLAILVEECFGFGAGIMLVTGAIGNAGHCAGGIRFYDNTVIGRGAAINTTASRVSTTTPLRIGGSIFILQQPAVGAGTSGHVVDDGYNRLYCGAANTNCADGTGTVAGTAPNLVLPHLVKWGLEMPRADMFGWTDAAHANQKFSASDRTTPDFRGRTPRPWGAGASIGCWQARALTHDTSSAITGGGANSLKLTGAGEVSVFIPVDAAGFTVSVTTKSTSYGGTNYPQIVVVAMPAIGVTSDTTATATDGTERVVTTATITPTAKGVVEVRLISRSSSTTSVTYFDILTRTP